MCLQRKKTLLKEYEEKDRAGGIVDRRFGENDPSMTPEERMLERFTRERQRSSKGVAFNLDDEEELTHYGQSLSKLDDFDNTGLTLDASPHSLRLQNFCRLLEIRRHVPSVPGPGAKIRFHSADVAPHWLPTS